MKEEVLTDAVLREFLLGKVDDEEAARIESLFLTDSEARERVLVIEQELIEDYLEDSLTAEEREKFLLRYGQTAAQLQQLRITKAIKDWAVRESARVEAVPVELSMWSRLRARLRLNPVFVVPIAVTVLIAIFCAAIWLNSRIKHAAIERELAQLNTPASLREVPPQMFSMDLTPIAVRSVEGGKEFKKSTDDQIVELRLPRTQKERYPNYQAEVRRVSGAESFTIPNLPAENDGMSPIRLRLPARILSRGQYQVRLRGVSSDGTVSQLEEYQFTIVN
jgi:hypothetical protein